MATPTDILTLTQWFSPAYPIGSFAYSHGLEAAIDQGQVHDAATARAWLADVLRFGAGRTDAIVLHLAHGAGSAAEVQRLDAEVRALASSAGRLKETDLQGAAFASITRELGQADLPDLCFPVAVGRAARLAGLPPTLTAQFYLQAFVSNLAAVAMRLVPLGQSQGQRLIRDLTPDCEAIAADAAGCGIEDATTSAFLSDIHAMQHETQYSRIFRT